MEMSDEQSRSSVVRDSLVGTIIDGSYEILEPLGRGGMATVYKAHQVHMDRLVALKLVAAHGNSSGSLGQRLRREARSLSLLSHPNIVACHAVGIHDDYLYIVMELVQGQTLADLVKAEGPLPRDRFLGIFVRILDALEHAHKLKVVHRDLKPENIMIVRVSDGSESAKIIDFGIARLLEQSLSRRDTRTGAFVGSPMYMSPEQCSGKSAVDERADIYCLGAVMYFALTGKPPFSDGSVLEILQRQVSESIPALPSSVPPEVARVVYMAMEKDPEDRFESAREMLSALESGLWPVRTEKSRKAPGRRRQGNRVVSRLVVTCTIAGVIALLLISKMTGLLSGGEQSRSAVDKTVAEYQRHEQQMAVSKRLEPDCQLAACRLLRARLDYASKLLDHGDVVDAAAQAGEIPATLKQIWQKTDPHMLPCLDNETLERLEALSVRFDQSEEKDIAADLLATAIVSLEMRAHLDAGSPSAVVEHVTRLLELAHGRRLSLHNRKVICWTGNIRLGDRPSAYQYAAIKCAQSGDMKKALVYARKAFETRGDFWLESRPRSETGRQVLGLAKLLLYHETLNAQARTACEEAVNLFSGARSDDFSTASAAYYYLAQSCREPSSQDRSKALTYLNSSISLADRAECSIVPACIMAARIAGKCGDNRKKEEFLSRALKSDFKRPLPEEISELESARMILAEFLLEDGHPGEAQRQLTQRLQEVTSEYLAGSPKWFDAMMKIANCMAKTAQYGESRRVFKIVQDTALDTGDYSGFVDASIGLCTVALQQQDYLAAEEAILEALQKLPPNLPPAKLPALKKAALHQHLATAEISLGKNMEAVREAKQSLAEAEKLTGPHRDAVRASDLLTLGAAYSRQGRFADAEAPLQEAHRLWESLATDYGIDNASCRKNAADELEVVVRKLRQQPSQ